MITMQHVLLSGPVYDLSPGKTNSGNDILTFKVKTWRGKGRGHDDKVCFFKVVAYGGNAVVLSEHLVNGKMITVFGTPDLYKDREGVEHFQVIMINFSFHGDVVHVPGV